MEVDWILKSLYQRFYVQFRLPAMCIGELSAVITQLMSKCLWSGWMCSKGYKEIASTLTCSPVNPEYLWKKRQIKKTKKNKLFFTTCKNRLSVYVDEKHLESFKMEVPILQKPVQWFAEQANGLVSIQQESAPWKS